MENKKRLKVLKGLASIVCSMIGTFCIIFGEIDDAPGLGGIGLILIAASIYLNSKLLYKE